jgi:hypothetical protein
MNRYDCELVRQGQKWRFTRITIDNAWAQGDPEILNALATHRALTPSRARRNNFKPRAGENQIHLNRG